jgi:hypothetical protein
MKKLLMFVWTVLAAGMTVAVAGMKAPPDPLPKESKTVEEDGLSLAVRLAKTEWRADEPLEFTIVLKNVSDKPLALWNADSYRSYHIIFNVYSDDRDAGWEPEWLAPEKTTAVADLKSQALQPGQSFELPVSLRGLRWQYAARTKMPVKPRDRLEPGMWTLQVTRDMLILVAKEKAQGCVRIRGASLTNGVLAVEYTDEAEDAKADLNPAVGEDLVLCARHDVPVAFFENGRAVCRPGLGRRAGGTAGVDAADPGGGRDGAGHVADGLRAGRSDHALAADGERRRPGPPAETPLRTGRLLRDGRQGWRKGNGVDL